jgi:hypothetical protein
MLMTREQALIKQIENSLMILAEEERLFDARVLELEAQGRRKIPWP